MTQSNPIPLEGLPIISEKVIEPTPLSLMEAAIEKGFNAEQLKTILDLQERMEAMRSKREYAVSMSEAQRAMPVVARDKKNTHTNKWYATLESVSNQIRPIYLSHGFSLSFAEGVREGELKREGYISIYCDILHIGGHSVRHYGEFAIDKAGTGGKDNKTAIQATGSTYSYARRYLTLMIFNIVIVGEDNDGQSVDPVISADQMVEINGLLDECRLAGQEVEFGRFLKWAGIPSLDVMTQGGYVKAIAELNRKRRIGKAVAK